jgi:hypothetical protein
MFRGESRFFRKWPLANVGESGESGESWVANVDKCIESGESELANVDECIESNLFSKKGHFGEYSNSPKNANFWRVLKFDKFAGEWPLLSLDATISLGAKLNL